LPANNLNALATLRGGIDFNRWRDKLKRTQVVHDQPHVATMLTRKLSCQAPADADIAVVIDYTAKNIYG
jgi:hypothetical protein